MHNKIGLGVLIGGLVLSTVVCSEFNSPVQNPPQPEASAEVIIANGDMYKASAMMWNIPRVKPCNEQPGKLTCLEEVDWENVKTVMFGELHSYVVASEKVYVIHDEEYVRAALPFLKEHGFNHLLLEVDKDEPALTDFLEGNLTADELYASFLTRGYSIPRAYVSMVEDAVALGFTVHAIDATPGQGDDNKSPRAREMGTLENLTEIMEANPEGRFIIFYGEKHIQECEKADLSQEWGKVEEAPPLGYLITALLDGSGMENLTISLVNSGQIGVYDWGINVRGFLDED